jgi:hypothetical protein
LPNTVQEKKKKLPLLGDSDRERKRRKRSEGGHVSQKANREQRVALSSRRCFSQQKNSFQSLFLLPSSSSAFKPPTSHLLPFQPPCPPRSPPTSWAAPSRSTTRSRLPRARRSRPARPSSPRRSSRRRRPLPKRCVLFRFSCHSLVCLVAFAISSSRLFYSKTTLRRTFEHYACVCEGTGKAGPAEGPPRRVGELMQLVR